MIGSPPNSPPTLSVTMAVFRPHPVYYPQAVRSILQQTWRDLELILVEDPSERSGREMLAGLEDPRLRYFTNPRRTSLVEQRNRCLAEARADLVATMDADDVAEPQRLERQVEFLQQNAAVGVLGSHIQLIDPNGRPLGYRLFPVEHAAILRALPHLVPINQPSVMYRKSLILSVGGYQDTAYGVAEDYDLWSRLALQGVRFANLPEPLLRYRLHPEQMKATRMNQTIRAVLAVKRKYWRERMTLSARLRLWVEQGLLALPESWVLKLLLWLQFNDRLTPSCSNGEFRIPAFPVRVPVCRSGC